MDGQCLLVCRECSEEIPLFMPFRSYRERGRWAAEHTEGTGHRSWFCLDGWPSPAEVAERMAEHDATTKGLREFVAFTEARAATSGPPPASPNVS